MNRLGYFVALLCAVMAPSILVSAQNDTAPELIELSVEITQPLDRPDSDPLSMPPVTEIPGMVMDENVISLSVKEMSLTMVLREIAGPGRKVEAEPDPAATGGRRGLSYSPSRLAFMSARSAR